MSGAHHHRAAAWELYFTTTARLTERIEAALRLVKGHLQRKEIREALHWSAYAFQLSPKETLTFGLRKLARGRAR